MRSKNKITIACAGSGKTTSIVEEAIKLKNYKVLVTTYTLENLDQLKMFFIEKVGYIPPNITIQSWYSFLLKEGVRPYQNYMTNKKRVRSIFFQNKSSPYHKKDNYFTSSNSIYSNKVAEFVFECNKANEGLVFKRLEKIYNYIFIDELQDFAAYDLEILEKFFKSKINIIAVGDPRQATFSTNNALKNKQYRKSDIFLWLKKKEKSQDIVLEENNSSYRCNQQICNFANKLFPDFPLITSKSAYSTSHDGIFCVSSDELTTYKNMYNPVLLKYSIKTDTLNFPATNIGLSKGRTYNRVLIFPTKPMLEFLTTEDPSKAGDKSKLYVAVTRARHSVAFLVNDKCLIKKSFLQG